MTSLICTYVYGEASRNLELEKNHGEGWSEKECEIEECEEK